MTKLFSSQDADLLLIHLKAIATVELFTIPVYLTGVYSFTNAAANYSDKKDPTKTPYDVQQKALSVAIQEMYHLQLACNIANAFQVTPEVPHLKLQAGVELTAPHLDPSGEPLRLKLGNLPAMIEAMIEVEKPDTDKEYPEPNKEATYHSISDLYHATLKLLGKYLDAYENSPQELDPHFKSNNKQIAAETFLSRYPNLQKKNRQINRNRIIHKWDVKSSINAITDQGEGRVVAGKADPKVTKHFLVKQVDSDEVNPDYQPTPGSRFYVYDNLTHYGRFVAIQTSLKDLTAAWEKAIGGSVFYEDNGKLQADLPAWAQALYEKDQNVFQDALNKIWSYLIDTIQTAVETGELHPPAEPNPGFREAMLSFKYLIPLIWQTGHCPSFEYEDGVTAAQAQAAMDSVDPLFLFHWDALTTAVRDNPAFEKNACQGLNDCAGQGLGGIATQKGDGACATADFHTCQGGNSCKYQGGCGFLSAKLPGSEQWVPGENSCATPSQAVPTGGCQTPISDRQVFNPQAEIQSSWPKAIQDRLTALKEKDSQYHNVWTEARHLFAARIGKQNEGELPAPLKATIDGNTYDGDARRKAVTATSTD